MHADIALVLEGTYPYRLGGVTTWVDGLVRALPALRFGVVHLYAGAAPQGRCVDVPPNVVWQVDLALPDDLTSLDPARLAARVPACSLVHALSTGFAGLVAAETKRQRGVPLLLTEHGIYWHEVEQGAPELETGLRLLGTDVSGGNPCASRAGWVEWLKASAREAYAAADAVTTVTEANRPLQARLGLRDGEVIPNGVHHPDTLAALRPAELRRLHSSAAAPADLRIGFVGRVTPLKDVHAIVRAFADALPRLPGARLHLIGPTDDSEYAASCRRLAGLRGEGDPADAGPALVLAYPDRLAKRTAETPREVRYQLREGHTAVLPATDPLADSEWLAVASLDARVGAARIFLAAPLEAEEVETLFADQIEREEVVEWDDAAGRVSARRVERLGALVLREGPLRSPDPEAVQSALFDGVRQRGLDILHWTKTAERLRQRLAFLHHHEGEPWPDVSDAALLDSLGTWLAPFARNARSLADLKRADLATALDALLPWDRRRDFDRLAPERLAVASGANVALDYSSPEAPALAVKLQETFGMAETPRVLGGRVPVVMHLLSPARRPVQVTTDLASFWETGYFDVRKDLRGRYPKHPWPEDPLTATATARTKRRR